MDWVKNKKKVNGTQSSEQDRKEASMKLEDLEKLEIDICPHCLKLIKAKLKELRKMCKHSEHKIKNINFGVGASELRKVCNFCDKTIGFPTQKDLKDNGYK